MSIRIRVVDGLVVAICAARSVPKDGDVYLDDGHHHALALKFAEDFANEGRMAVEPVTDRSAYVRSREESNNPARAWWDSVYAVPPSARAEMLADTSIEPDIGPPRGRL